MNFKDLENVKIGETLFTENGGDLIFLGLNTSKENIVLESPSGSIFIWPIASANKLETKKPAPRNNFYRKKPVVIEAVQFNGENYEECKAFLGEENYDNNLGYPNIITPEGVMSVSNGDYITKGVAGEFYPCKPDVFKKTYVKENIGDVKQEPRATGKTTWIKELCSGELKLVVQGDAFHKGFTESGRWVEVQITDGEVFEIDKGV